VPEPLSDVADHTHRHRAFVAIVRARLLRVRFAATQRRCAWLMAQARYRLKDLPIRHRSLNGAGRVVAIGKRRAKSS
jgi:hypothetical protein